MFLKTNFDTYYYKNNIKLSRLMVHIQFMQQITRF